MFLTIITDCKDDNAFGRQMTRGASLFGYPPVPVGASDDIEAAGNLIDMLDASEGREGVVIANIAPRHGKAKKWKNGTPFGYFWYNKTLVVSTVDGYTTSLVKKLGLTDKIQVMDIEAVLNYVKDKELYREQSNYIKKTQFRSYEFTPRAAKWVWKGTDIPAEEHPIADVPTMPNCVWWSDNFGNLKTTLLPEDIGFEVGKKIELKGIGEVTCYERLKDVPNDGTGMIIGSSGIMDKRFLEVVIQGKSAAKTYNIQNGHLLFD